MIRLENVCKAFGSNVVLDGFALEIAQGETVVVLGRSGSGKSVMLKHIVGLIRPDSGHVFVDDVDVAAADAKSLRAVRRRVALLFQTGALVNWMSVRANVALPLVERRQLKRAEINQRVEEVLAKLEMLDAADRLPGEISGGMRKRAALARVLVQDPAAILYDEPTAGLDPILARTVAALIQDVQVDRHNTALVVTHDLELAFAIADRIGLHSEGRLVELGPPDVFRKSQHPIVRSFLDGTMRTAASGGGNP